MYLDEDNALSSSKNMLYLNTTCVKKLMPTNKSPFTVPDANSYTPNCLKTQLVKYFTTIILLVKLSYAG